MVVIMEIRVYMERRGWMSVGVMSVHLNRARCGLASRLWRTVVVRGCSMCYAAKASGADIVGFDAEKIV